MAIGFPENRGFFADFRHWLKDTGYGPAALKLYSVVVRQVMGFLDKPYWTIDPDADLQRAWEHLIQRPVSATPWPTIIKGC